MRNKPLYLIFFPYLAFAIALSFPVQIVLIYGVPLDDPAKIISMLTPLNLLTMSSMVLTGILSLTMSKHIYKIIPVLLLVTFANNAIVGLYGSDYTMFQVALSFILFGISLKPFYSKEIKAVITEPKLRWWLTPTRYEMELPIKIHSELVDFTSESLNMSKTGIFAKAKDDYYLEKININDIIDLQILEDSSPITLKARVVRKSQNNNQLPNGFGLEFIRDDFHKKEYLPWLKQAVT